MKTFFQRNNELVDRVVSFLFNGWNNSYAVQAVGTDLPLHSDMFVFSLSFEQLHLERGLDECRARLFANSLNNCEFLKSRKWIKYMYATNDGVCVVLRIKFNIE